MNFVPRDRLELIREWNERPLLLKPEHLTKLEIIGRTPPDIYGNGAQFHQTPCCVLTQSGERIDLAIVCMQQHAPFEDWRKYRLASEIHDIQPSPYALPLAVRVASSKAGEIRMGFAPTLVQLPDGKVVILNWTQSFFLREGCDASAITLSTQPLDMKNRPDIYEPPRNVTYFVADLPTGLHLREPPSSPPPQPLPAKQGLLRKLLKFRRAT